MRTSSGSTARSWNAPMLGIERVGIEPRALGVGAFAKGGKGGETLGRAASLGGLEVMQRGARDGTRLTKGDFDPLWIIPGPQHEMNTGLFWLFVVGIVHYMTLVNRLKFRVSIMLVVNSFDFV